METMALAFLGRCGREMTVGALMGWSVRRVECMYLDVNWGGVLVNEP